MINKIFLTSTLISMISTPIDALDRLSRCDTLGQAVLAAKTADDAKKEYRKFAVNCHPDKFKTPKEKKTSQELFINVTDAYEKAIGKAPTAAEYTPPTPGYAPEWYETYGGHGRPCTSPQDESLLNAAGRGDKQGVEEAIAAGAHIDCVNRNGVTALMKAAQHGRADIVRLLIERKATIDIADYEDATALHYAADYPEIIKILIEAGADVNVAGQYTNTPLIQAARRGNKDIVTLLLQAGAGVNDADEYGNTALLEATIGHHTDVARILLEHKADPNRATLGFRTTPLRVARARGYNDIVDLLLKYGARSDEGTIAADKALAEAVYRGNKQGVEKAIAEGANVNSVNVFNVPPLKEAAARGYEDIVKMLIAAGAEVNHIDENGYTPLLEATINGHTNIVKILLEHKADPNLATFITRITPLMAARKSGYNNIVDLLLYYGARS